jgi:hypothetical protein
VTASGRRVSTLAGRAGVAGYADGPAAVARFDEPVAVCAAPHAPDAHAPGHPGGFGSNGSGGAPLGAISGEKIIDINLNQ